MVASFHGDRLSCLVTCSLRVASFQGHSQILSCICGENYHGCAESGIGTKLQLNLIEVNNAIIVALRTVGHANFETASTIYYLVNKRKNEIANFSGLIGGKPHLC